MWKPRKTPSEPPRNLLDLKPSRRLEWEVIDEERVALLVPRFTHPFWVKHLVPRLKKPFMRVKLDPYGSLLWTQCDGSATVEEIGLRMKERFGDGVEPLYERMGAFIARLAHEKWLELG
jgi:hypothetical protein